MLRAAKTKVQQFTIDKVFIFVVVVVIIVKVNTRINGISAGILR